MLADALALHKRVQRGGGREGISIAVNVMRMQGKERCCCQEE